MMRLIDTGPTIESADAARIGADQPLLEVRELAVRYGDVPALESCSIDVHRGEVVGFVGSNGAGKTTTMRAILGVVGVAGGRLSWNGEPLGMEHRRRIGYLPQERGLYPRMQVEEQVVYFGRLAGLSPGQAESSAGRWLERVGVADRASSRVQELSIGNQRRVQLAVALVHDPELLVLDEPFAGLDPPGVVAMREVLAGAAAEGTGVLFSSHQLDVVQQLCRRVSVIQHGCTVAGGLVDDIRLRSERRIVSVTWARPDTIVGELAGIDVVETLDATPTSWSASVTSSTTPAEMLAALSELGPVASFSFEAPSLVHLFDELVSP